MQQKVNEEIKTLVMSDNKEDIELAVSLLYNIDEDVFKIKDKTAYNYITHPIYEALGGTGKNFGTKRLEIINEHIKKMGYYHESTT